MSTSVAFDLGSTYHGTAGTIPSSYTEEVYLEGLESVFPDLNSSGVKQSGRKKHARIMRNVSGATLYGGMAVSHKGGYFNRRFDSNLASTDVSCAGVIDDGLPSTGCRNGDLCWVIHRGPVRYRTLVDSAETAVGDILAGVTAATGTLGTTSTAGHLQTVAVTNASSDQDNEALFAVGVVDEAATSGETNTLKRAILNIGI